MMPDPNRFTVHFWGVRGSYPTPGRANLRYGGNTACISVQFSGHTLILDSGTGIIQLGRQLVQQSRQAGKDPQIALLFSHYHHDHTQGFPFFAPTRLPNAHISVFGPRQFHHTGPREVLEMIMSQPVFPLTLAELPAQLEFSDVRSGDLLLAGGPGGLLTHWDPASASDPNDPFSARVRVCHSSEHPNGVLHYRIEWCGRSIVYATDREGIPGPEHPLVNFSRGADLLIHNSQYTQAHYEGKSPDQPSTRGFGHSTIQMACEVARLAGVGQLALFHLDPTYDDQQVDRLVVQAQAWFPNTIASYDGLELAYQPCEAPE